MILRETIHGRQVCVSNLNDKSIPFADWLRASATIMILLCHFCQQKESFWFNAAAQVLNIGVPLFFILSGYLFGQKGVHSPYGKWFLRRLQRLWIPYWLFLLVLAIIYLIKGLNILTWDWLLLIFGLQGSVVGVWGAEQTWFITVLLICYGVTPWISKVAEKIDRKHTPYALACLSLFPFLLQMMQPEAISTLLAPVCLYTVAFFIGNRNVSVNISNLGACIATTVVILSFGLRFILRIFFDGTMFYSRTVASYTHYAAALAIFYLFAWFFAERKPTHMIKFFGRISFEIYLFHYMFTVGPISLFSATPFWIVNCLLVFGVTFLIATVMNYIGTLIKKRIFTK